MRKPRIGTLVFMASAAYVGFVGSNILSAIEDYKEGQAIVKNTANPTELRDAARDFAGRQLAFLTSPRVLNPIAHIERKPYEPVYQFKIRE